MNLLKLIESMGYVVLDMPSFVEQELLRSSLICQSSTVLNQSELNTFIQILLKNGVIKKEVKYEKIAYLTHDIDHVDSYSIKERLRLLQTIKTWNSKYKLYFVLGFVKSLIYKYILRRKYLSLKEWSALEQQYGFTATYFFLGEPFKYKRHYLDSAYFFEDKVDGNSTIKNCITYLAEMGHDIGLHGGYYAGQSVNQMRNQMNSLANVLRGPILSQRFHHLLWNSNSANVISQAGLKIDSSLGFNNRICKKHELLDPFMIKTDKITLWEFPIAIQDVGLKKQYKSFDQCQLAISRLLDHCEELEIRPTFLWHNNYRKDSLEVRLYEFLLKELHVRGFKGAALTHIDYGVQ